MLRQRNTEGEKRMLEEGMIGRIEEERISIELEPIKKEEQLSCKCPKSKCLLLYCECFSKGVVCNEQCSCYQCRNNTDF
jgi:hypothetical protein